MNTVILALALFLAVAVATPENEYQSAFTQWMHHNKKNYQSDEFQARYAAFKFNYDFVANWDAKARGFEVELNKFADLTIDEFSKIYLGTKIAASNYALVDEKVEKGTVDWRTKGYVTPIKDQGQCGSCYTFSAIAATEGAWFKKNNKLVSFSEKQLVDCSTSYGNQGCNGGLMDNCFKYIIANGIATEADYPYQPSQGSCQTKTAAGHLSSFKDITSGSESALATAIKSVGPISVAIDASHSSFQMYKSGVYNEPACSATALDHGVTAVGYDASSYIVKNSWGTTWGNQGYINMSRGKSNQCGIATAASYPVA